LTTRMGAAAAASLEAREEFWARSRSRCLRRWLRDMLGSAGKSS
jgi:hypothetical protein